MDALKKPNPRDGYWWTGRWQDEAQLPEPAPAHHEKYPSSPAGESASPTFNRRGTKIAVYSGEPSAPATITHSPSRSAISFQPRK